MSKQRKEKFVLNSRRERIDEVVTEKISLEAKFCFKKTKKLKNREEEWWNDKGKHRLVRVYDKRRRGY